MTESATTLPACDPELLKRGVGIGVYATSGASAFEKLIVQVRRESGRPVDWHYVGGRAVVRVFPEDVDHVTPYLERIVGRSHDR